MFCSRETWKAWWEANPRRESSQKRAIRRFVNEITFTGFFIGA